MSGVIFESNVAASIGLRVLLVVEDNGEGAGVESADKVTWGLQHGGGTFKCSRNHFFLPTANTLSAERTYITPSDSAGVAIKSSPIVFVAIWENF